MDIELSDNEDNTSRDKVHSTTFADKIRISLAVGDDDPTSREGCDNSNNMKPNSMLSSIKGRKYRDDGRDEIVFRTDRGSKSLPTSTGTTGTSTFTSYGIVIKSGCSTPETIDLSPTVFKRKTMMITPPFGGSTSTSASIESSSDDGSTTETEPIFYYQRRGRFIVWPVDQNIVRISGQNV